MKKLDLRSLIRQPLIFPEQVSLLMALEQFRQAQTHFAFVVDEFGSIEGGCDPYRRDGNYRR